MLRREKLLWALFVAAALTASLWVLWNVVSLAAQVAAAVVALVAGVIAVVVKHGFDMEAQRRHAAFLAKQDNYRVLLATIGDFARKQPHADDRLSSAHLASWAFGDLAVLEATNEFQRQRSSESLIKLLASVRAALQHEPLPPSFRENYDATVLFPPKEKTEEVPGLTQGAT